MPIGDQSWQVKAQTPITGPVLAPSLGAGGLPHQGRPAASAAADVWRNFSLPASMWAGGKAALDFQGTVTVLEVFVIGEDPLFLSFRNAGVSSAAGSYELFHPGRGQLVEVVPNITRLWLATATGAAPTDRVEVIGKGGLFGVPAGIQLWGS